MISKKPYLKPHEVNIVQQHWDMQKKGNFNLELYEKILNIKQNKNNGNKQRD